MPVVTVTLIQGYEPEVRRELSRRLTDAVRATIAAPLDGVTIIVNEVDPANYMRGRQARTPGAPLPPARETVRGYLDAMEARDLAAARGFLSEGFQMTFPGGARFTDPQELATWASQRYRFVGKTYERIDEVPGEAGVTVYCSGTLAGEWLDGTAFSGIRFIDRFTVEGDRIGEQQVWNDMGELRGEVRGEART